MTRAIDPDIENEEDAVEEVEEEQLDTDTDDEEEDEPETDKPAAKGKKASAPALTVEQLQTQLAAAQARAQQAAAAAVRERKARRAGGVNKNGKATTPGGAEIDPEDRSKWPEAARKAVEKLEADQAKAATELETGRQRAVDTAIRNGLVKAGLKLPEGAGPEADEARRLAFKRVLRMMDTEGITQDSDGDIVGVEDEISLVMTAVPDLFNADSLRTAAEAAALANGTTPKAGAGTPKPKINPGGGRQRDVGAGAPKFDNSASFLLSKEYKNRRRGSDVE